MFITFVSIKGLVLNSACQYNGCEKLYQFRYSISPIHIYHQVFQHRSGGSTGFYQNWDAYKEGFGDLNGDFWLGNEKLHYLTNQMDYKLRFDVTTSSGSSAYAEYAEFEIESEANYYRMNQLGTRSGNTGS